MKKLLRTLVFVPVAFVLLVFAVANRHAVKLSLDPFASLDTTNLSISCPLFVVIFGAVMFGIICGSTISWLANGKYRAAARQVAGTSGGTAPGTAPGSGRVIVPA